MLSLYQLQIFQTVAQTGSFSRAADQLYLSQPAVSQHIQALETDLGVQLFLRGRRGVKLTPSGETLRDYAHCLLQLAVEARKAVTLTETSPEPFTEQFSIGASPGAGVYLLPNWIQSFHQTHPGLTVILKTAITPVIIQALLTGDIKVGIIEGELEDEPIEWVPLWDEEIVLVVAGSHPWHTKKSVDIEALADQQFIVRETGSLTRAWEDHLLGEHNLSPHIIAEFDSPVAIKQAVVSGLGVALLPRFALQNEDGRLHALRLGKGTTKRTLKLIWAKNTLFSRAVQAFVGHLSHEFPHLPLQIMGGAMLSTEPGQSRSIDLQEDCAPQICK